MILIPEALRLARRALAEAGLEEPGRESRAVVAHAAGLTTGAVAVASGPMPRAAFERALARRVAREPMAFIAGTREFFGLEFAVSPATLIPRPDSEVIVEQALMGLSAAPGLILDLGTGTGCLLLSVLHARPALRGVGVDVSVAAAALAAGNAAALGLGSRALMVAGRWADAIDPATRFDAILSNPPYIPSGTIPGLMPEVAAYEPAGALDGGADGLDAYRALAPVLARHLAPHGVAVVEFGTGQEADLKRMLQKQGFAITIAYDLGGLPRAAVARWPRTQKAIGSALARH